MSSESVSSSASVLTLALDLVAAVLAADVLTALAGTAGEAESVAAAEAMQLATVTGATATDTTDELVSSEGAGTLDLQASDNASGDCQRMQTVDPMLCC